MAVEVSITMAMDGTGVKQYSWTEKHVLLASPGSLDDNFADYRNLANKRIALCGANAYLVSVRASRPGVRRDVSVGYGSDPDSGLLQYGGFPGLMCAPPETALRIRHQADDSQWGFFYMAGVPTALISTDPPGPVYAAVPGWDKKFQVYKTFLENNSWGALYMDNPPVNGPMVIQGWANEAAAQLRLIASVNNADAFAAQGDIVHIRDVKMLDRTFKRPVGRMRIATKTVGATTTDYVLANTTGFDASNILSNGTMESISFSYLPYKEITMVGQANHKRGGSATRAHGRSLHPTPSLV